MLSAFTLEPFEVQAALLSQAKSCWGININTLQFAPRTDQIRAIIVIRKRLAAEVNVCNIEIYTVCFHIDEIF